MKKYFYKDNDQIKKYVYCTRGCQEPYKQDDLGNTILKVNNTTFLCLKCAKTLKIQTELSGAANNIQTKEFFPVLIKDDDETLDIMVENIIKTDDLEPCSSVLEQTSLELPTIEQELIVPVLEPTIEQKTTVSETLTDSAEKNEKNESEVFVFVVKCKDGTFYVGTTSTSVQKSIRYHNQGCGSSYTKPKERRPVLLIESQKTTRDEIKNVKDTFNKKYGLV